jgi:hypothetical protein
MTDISVRLRRRQFALSQKDIGVAAVPGSSFYKNAAKGRTKLRSVLIARYAGGGGCVWRG